MAKSAKPKSKKDSTKSKKDGSKKSVKGKEKDKSKKDKSKKDTSKKGSKKGDADSKKSKKKGGTKKDSAKGKKGSKKGKKGSKKDKEGSKKGKKGGKKGSKKDKDSAKGKKGSKKKKDKSAGSKESSKNKSGSGGSADSAGKKKDKKKDKKDKKSKKDKEKKKKSKKDDSSSDDKKGKKKKKKKKDSDSEDRIKPGDARSAALHKQLLHLKFDDLEEMYKVAAFFNVQGGSAQGTVKTDIAAKFVERMGGHYEVARYALPEHSVSKTRRVDMSEFIEYMLKDGPKSWRSSRDKMEFFEEVRDMFDSKHDGCATYERVGNILEIILGNPRGTSADGEYLKVLVDLRDEDAAEQKAHIRSMLSTVDMSPMQPDPPSLVSFASFLVLLCHALHGPRAAALMAKDSARFVGPKLPKHYDERRRARSRSRSRSRDMSDLDDSDDLDYPIERSTLRRSNPSYGRRYSAEPRARSPSASRRQTFGTYHMSNPYGTSFHPGPATRSYRYDADGSVALAGPRENSMYFYDRYYGRYNDSESR